MPIGEDIAGVQAAALEAADGFKKMQMALIIFAFIVTLSMILISVSIYKLQTSNE